jgi:hypothetical protein
MTALEKRLYESAVGYKNLPSCAAQVYREALATGIAEDEAARVTNKVIQLLRNTEKAKLGTKYGKAHDPREQYKHLALVIRQLKI